MNNLNEFLNLNEKETDFLCSFFDEDMGEMVDHVDEKGIYIMDIACDINHYTMLPISREEFIKMMMKRVAEKLNSAAESYYNKSKELMSNLEYDKLYDELEKLEKKTGIIVPNSPTQKVGPKESSGLKDVTHEYPARSLDKTKDINEYIKAFKKVADTGVDDLLWVTPKMDGITGVATYEEGNLVLLATRGNGEVGKDITDKAPFVKGLPMKIDYKGKLIVRGEMVMTYSEFERINQTMDADSQYKNPRNLASGTINQPENKDIQEREIVFCAFQLVYIDDEQYCSKSYDLGGIIEKSFNGRMVCLSDLGFNTVQRWSATLFSLEKVVKAATEQLKVGDYPVDGLVTVMDDIRAVKNLPDTGHHPNRAKGFAFKWADETEETVLREIEWSASRTGLLNPVAVFDPVELCGTTVSRASLHNLSYIADMDLRIGDKITVYKANMIIPQIAENLDNRNPKVRNVNSYLTISRCPVCGRPVSIGETEGGDTYVARCTNPSCGAKRIGEIVHATERDCLDIKGLSEKKVEFLIQNGFIENLLDLFRLNNQGHGAGVETLPGKPFKILEDCDGWEVKSVDNLLNAIDEARDTDFVSFIHAMGIPNVGKGQAKELKKYLDANYDELEEEYMDLSDGSYDLMELLTNMVAGDFDFTKIDGFGEVIARSLYTWVEVNLVDPVRQYLDGDDPACEVINILAELRFHDEKPKTSSNEAIKGKTFVITGSLNHYKNRDELVSVIESLGGKVSSSVSKNTNYLINNDVESTSGKNKKARELGIPIISEIEFMEVI